MASHEYRVSFPYQNISFHFGWTSTEVFSSLKFMISLYVKIHFVQFCIAELPG